MIHPVPSNPLIDTSTSAVIPNGVCAVRDLSSIDPTRQYVQLRRDANGSNPQ
jgi:hypothetical protein